jgi:hypothetical protein
MFRRRRDNFCRKKTNYLISHINNKKQQKNHYARFSKIFSTPFSAIVQAFTAWHCLSCQAKKFSSSIFFDEENVKSQTIKVAHAQEVSYAKEQESVQEEESVTKALFINDEDRDGDATSSSKIQDDDVKFLEI